MDVMIENKVVPKLRFGGFTKDWSTITINELVNRKILDKPLDGNHGNIHPKSSDYVEEGVPFIMANDINNGYIDLINCKKIRKSQAETLQKGFAKEADILLSHKATIGETAIVPKIDYEYIVLTPQVTYYRVINKQSYLNTFLYQVFKTNRFVKSMKVNAGGAGGVRLYIGITEQRKLSVPNPSLPEQQKIASFLSAVDEKLQQLKKKKDLLEEYKKGVMQKIFSQELHFKDDNGNNYPDWEEKRIEDLFIVTRGTVLAIPKISPHKNDECPYPVFSSQTKNNGIAGYYKDYLFEDAITWTTDGAQAGEVNLRKGKFYCTNVCGVLKSDEGYANLCIAEKLNRVSRRYVSYVGNPKLMNNVMAKIKISIPTSLDEHQKIADFLSSLDSKIELVNTQIDNTKAFKKGLLQQMFV